MFVPVLKIPPPQRKEKKVQNPSLDMSFIKYMEDAIKAENIRIGTRKHKICVIDAVRRFGKIKKLSDLTPANIMAFDKWLRDGTRTEITIYGYHKNIKCYEATAYSRDDFRRSL